MAALRILSCMCNYNNSRFQLDGVNKDLENLDTLCAQNNIPLVSLFEEMVTFENLRKNLSGKNMIWFSGHGNFNEYKQENCFYLSEYKHFGISFKKTILTQSDMLTLVEEDRSNEFMIFVLDMCHSGTFLDLDFKYNGNGKFERVNSAAPKIQSNTLIISISACTDKETTPDSTKMGGILCLYLFSILNAKSEHSLDTLFSECFEIYTNKIIDDTSKILFKI